MVTGYVISIAVVDASSNGSIIKEKIPVACTDGGGKANIVRAFVSDILSRFVIKNKEDLVEAMRVESGVVVPGIPEFTLPEDGSIVVVVMDAVPFV